MIDLIGCLVGKVKQIRGYKSGSLYFDKIAIRDISCDFFARVRILTLNILFKKIVNNIYKPYNRIIGLVFSG